MSKLLTLIEHLGAWVNVSVVISSLKLIDYQISRPASLKNQKGTE